MIALHERASGKLNLTLDVLGKRPDGYHELCSVMTAVSVCDELELTLDTGAPWQVRCDVPQAPSDRENLCWQAAALYCEAAGVSPQGLSVAIRKRIPMQAGMAGGSADAAAVLRALNRHFRRCSQGQLTALAEQVGSDVPFCLTGGTALARGRGERLQPLPDLPKELCYVLVKPDFSVSTPFLFRQLDKTQVCIRPRTSAMLAAIGSGEPEKIAAQTCNVFQPLAAQLYPQVEVFCERLTAAGALSACMTGTGSVIFGIFSDTETARAAAAVLQSEDCTVFTAGSETAEETDFFPEE